MMDQYLNSHSSFQTSIFPEEKYHHEKFMRLAFEQARLAVEAGNELFGAVLVKAGEVVAVGQNKINTENDPTYHAETGLIRDYCHQTGLTDFSDYTIYTSCEPCVMCADCMIWSKLGRMFYGISVAELDERDANIFPKKRVRTVTRGKGKKAHPVQLETELVGIKNIAMLDSYGPPEHTRHANRKNFKAKPLNAIAIKKWDNKKPRKGKAAVFITDLPVNNPFIGYDLYDDRSLIENCLWREEKQKWYLKNPPKRTAEGVAAHTFLTMTVFALATAFRYWNKDHQKKIEAGKTTGIQLFWRELRMKNRNKVLIFKGNKYGVFYLSEIMRLVGFRIKDADPGVGSRSQIMRKYGINRK